MTIGADMPLRSQVDSLVRDKAKDKHSPDKTPAKETSIRADFRTMVKTALPRLTTDKEDAVLENEPLEIAMPDKDIPASQVPPIFGQAILAFEQLLDRRQRGLDGAPPPVGEAEPAMDAAMDPSVMSETTIEVIGQETVDGALPDNNSGRPAQLATEPAELDAAGLGNTSQAPLNPGADQRNMPESAQSAAPEAPTGRTAAKLPDKAPAPVAETATASASQHAPVNVKMDAMPQASTPAALEVRPSVTGLVILSERTAGGAKTLVIQLQPIELGTVTARLRLTSDGMHIQLVAESREMAQQLASDHDALGKALQRAGVADDATTVTISVIDRSAAASNGQASQQNPTGQEQQANGRAYGQAQSSFQGAPDQHSSGQQPFGEFKPQERDEASAKAGIESRPSRGLVV